MLRLRIPALAAAAALVSACSFVAVDRLPGDFELGEVPECTDGLTVPALDAVGAVMTGATAVILHSTSRADAGFKNSAWVATGAAVVFIVAAAYGSHQVIRCRRAGALSVGRRPLFRPEDEPAPGTLGARCKSDKDCTGELVCDEPMHTCIPLSDQPGPDPLDPASRPE